MFVLEGQINNVSAFVQVMIRSRTGDNALSEPLVSLGHNELTNFDQIPHLSTFIYIFLAIGLQYVVMIDWVFFYIECRKLPSNCWTQIKYFDS